MPDFQVYGFHKVRADSDKSDQGPSTSKLPQKNEQHKNNDDSRLGIAWMIYKNFRISGKHEAVRDFGEPVKR